MIQKQQPRQRINILPQAVFLGLTFVAAVCGTYVALRLFGDGAEQSNLPQIITVEVIITATPLPTKLATAAPASSDRTQVDLPADIAAETADDSAAINPAALGAQDVPISTATVAVAGGPVFSQNCLYHTVVSGDTPFGIALRYGADFNLMLEVNNLTQESAAYLQIGDVLTVPLEGCVIPSESGGAVQVLSGELATPSEAATSTPVKAQFEILAAEGVGDITAEGIRLRNLGETVDISDWTISDSQGNSFTFIETLMFPDSAIVIYTRSGTSTSDARFWGREEAVWEAGEDLTISDAQGRALQVLQLPAPAES